MHHNKIHIQARHSIHECCSAGGRSGLTQRSRGSKSRESWAGTKQSELELSDVDQNCANRFEISNFHVYNSRIVQWIEMMKKKRVRKGEAEVAGKSD